MKQNRERQAASVVRAPTLIRIDLTYQRWRSRIIQLDEIIHQQIAADLDEHPEMMQPDVPPDPGDWLARWLRVRPMIDQPAPPSDDLHAGETVAVQQPTGRSFWSYAETAAR